MLCAWPVVYSVGMSKVNKTYGEVFKACRLPRCLKLPYYKNITLLLSFCCSDFFLNNILILLSLSSLCVSRFKTKGPK